MLRGLLDPARVATVVQIADTTLSYAALLTSASAVAEALTRESLPRIAIDATPTMDTVITVVGALLAGVEVVPIPADAGPGERAHILRDSGAPVWQVRSPLAEVRDQDSPGRAAYRLPDVSPDAGAFVLYTSGTTGPPKGVRLSRRAVAAGLDALADAWAWTANDALAHGLPLFHVHGLVLGVLGPLRIGSGLRHVGRPTPAAYAAAAHAGATMFFAVPTIWSRVAAEPEYAAALRSARLLVSGSAALPVPVFERLRELTGHEVCERYGMTETLITVATRADGARRAGWVGVPVAGARTRLVGDSGEPVPSDGETLGELQVCGPTLFDGYLGLPEATAAAFTADGWFRTGDVATIAPDGSHRIVGRASVDLIKSGGYRIGAGEIEGVLLGHPAVAECAVVGFPDEDLGQRIVAFVVPTQQATATKAQATSTTPPPGEELAAELIDLVVRELSVHKRPREVRFVDALPRNEMGKVQKTRLS